MKVLIRDQFDYYVMLIDLAEVCRAYMHKEKSKENGKMVTEYSKARCTKLFNKIAHAILWRICEEDPDDIEQFLDNNNPKAADLWRSVREHYSI